MTTTASSSPTTPHAVEISAPDPADNAGTNVAADARDLLGYAQELVSKQYDLYQWCETKVQSLVTVNGLLLGGFFLLIDRFALVGRGERALAFSTAGILAMSLLLALHHLIPRLDSRVGNTDNPRSVIGIKAFKNKDAFYQRFVQLDYDLMLQYTTNQLYGMNLNIVRNDRVIRRAVYLTMLGVLGFVALFIWKAR
jgi:hypothetical protein